MASQVAGTLLQVLLSWAMVMRFHWGVVGAGLAISFSNAFILYMNLFATGLETKLQPASEVKISDPEITKTMKFYLSYAVPTLVANLLNQGCFFFLSAISRDLSATQQQNRAILLTVQALLFQIPLGCQQVLCSYVGFEIAKGQNDRARKYLNVFVGLILASNTMELIIFIIHSFTSTQSHDSTLSQFNYLAILTIVLQSWHSMLAGLARALSFIKEYLFLTFITAALISTLSYDFAFKLDMRSKDENEAFVDGMQLAMVVSYGVGVLLYVMVLYKKEWKIESGK